MGAVEPEREEPVFGGILATTTVDVRPDRHVPEVTPYLSADRTTTIPLTTSTPKPQERA